MSTQAGSAAGGAVALLGSGPSVELYRGPGRYAAVLAVNRAISRIGPSWLKGAAAAGWAGPWAYWMMLDEYTFGMCDPPAWPGGIWMVTYRNEHGRILAQNPDAAEYASIYIEDVREVLGSRLPVATEWACYGITVGLAVALYLGARRVDVYGADQAGRADFDGFTDPRQKRDAERWAREKRIWGNVTAAVAAAGTEIRRATWDVQPAARVSREMGVVAGT